MRRAVFLLLSTSLALSFSLNLAPAASGQTFPGYTFSFYPTSASTSLPTWYQRGVALAGKMNTGHFPTQGIAVFDFGDQKASDHTYLAKTGTTFSYDYIADSMINLAMGFSDGTGGSSKHLTIVLGTNNEYNSTIGNHVDFSHGQDWATLVNSIDNALGIYTTDAVVVGGSDEELDFHATVAQTKDMLNGYEDIAAHHFFDFGDAAGCPQTTHTNGNCDHGYSQADVIAISWRPSASQPVFPIPEIYNEQGKQADEWEQIDLLSIPSTGGPDNGPMNVRASVTQYEACEQLLANASAEAACPGTANTANQGWAQLHNDLTAHSSTSQDLNWATDFETGWDLTP